MSRIFNSILVVMLLNSGFSYAQDYPCISGKISQLEFGKIKSEKAEYCFNEDKTVLISKGCQSMNCNAFKGLRKYKIEELFSSMGKPGFKLCRELGGQPQIIDFYVDNHPYKLDRCLFSDGEFVDTGYLLAFYLKN